MQQVAEVKPSGSGAIGEQTFADLLQPLIEPGFRLALAMLHDPQAAEDAVQEASFTAWRKVARMQDQGKLRPWFLGVVANKCRNARRTKWVAGVSLGLPEQLSVVSAEEPTLRGTDLRRASLVDHLADCILEDKHPVASAEHARHALEIMIKALESAKSGQVLDLTTTF